MNKKIGSLPWSSEINIVFNYFIYRKRPKQQDSFSSAKYLLLIRIINQENIHTLNKLIYITINDVHTT